MRKLSTLLQESAGYEFGCVMLNFQFAHLFSIHECISQKDLFIDESTKGFEDDPHVTLLYGLHDIVDVEDIRAIINNYTFGSITLEHISLFENGKYDVLKFDVFGDCLHDINSDLRLLPHTTNFPDYTPHMTIAYLKSGKGRVYAELLEDKSFEVKPFNVKFSTPFGDSFIMPIRIL